ncbi:amino acid ABC transporter permease [Ilumatobacter sp.]|uniref:amino acid ABC transporter permease n=1 Tax=Ilumatobacter sp. TaxID=1967498 RepID=UPI003AF43C5C
MTDVDGADTPAVSAPPRPSRAEYDRRQRRRGNLIAATSTAVVVAVLVIGVPRLSGWQRVRETFFDGETFAEAFPQVAEAFWLDVRIFLFCAPLILIWGMTIALARSVRSPVLFPLRLAATLYVDIVRGVPVLLWLFLIGFGGATLLNRRDVGIGSARVGTLLFLGAVGLVITYSAYVAEVFRAGIEGVHESQRSGARSLGLSTWQTNRYVVLPQAVRRVVPPLMNDFISLQKDVALVSVLGPVEALRRADVLQDRLFNFTPFVVAAILFLCVSIPLTRLADYLLTRERRAMSGTAVR